MLQIAAIRLLYLKTSMERITDSELTMATSNAFYNILQLVQNSSLNYQLQISPFSAIISLKKSPIKDKFGNPLVPRVSALSTSETSMKKELQKELEVMRRKCEDVEKEFNNANNIINELKKTIEHQDEIIDHLLVHDKTSKALDENDITNKVKINEVLKQCSKHHNLEHMKEMTDNDEIDYGMASKDSQQNRLLKELCLISYVPEYSKKIYPICSVCKKFLANQELLFNSLTRCSEVGINPSLLSHWIPTSDATLNVNSGASFKLRYVTPGRTSWMEKEWFKKLELQWEQNRKMGKNGCATS